MAYSLADLLDPPNEQQITDSLLATLAGVGFPVTSWFSGGAGRTLVQGFARVAADTLMLVSNVSRGGLLDLAPGLDPGSPGDWLTILAYSQFQTVRTPAQFAVARLTLSCIAGAGPHTITPGGLWVQTADGRRYNSTNTSNVIVPSNGSVTIDVRAENPGASYNLGLPVSLSLISSLPGTSAVTSETSGGSGTAMLVAGANIESDASLRSRCKSRWQTIGLQKTADAYDAVARDLASGTTDPVTRVRVNDTNPRGPGTLDIWIAGASGPLSAPNETLVRAFVVDRKAPTADVQVQNASPVVVNLNATIYVRGNAAAKDEAQARVMAAINAVPIGGVLYRAQLFEELMAPTGVFNATFTSLDLVLGMNQVATVGTIAITQVDS